jgi:hypothetical protein
VVDSTAGSASVAEALRAVGFAGTGIPARAIVRGGGGTVFLLPTIGTPPAESVQGLWWSREGVRTIGPVPPSNLLTESLRLKGPTAELVNLLQAGARAYLEFLEGLGERIDDVEDRWATLDLAQLGHLTRESRAARKAVGRFLVALQEFEGPTGERFPGLSAALPRLRSEFSELEDYAAGVGQSLRDLLSLRAAAESNRLAEATNRLGVVSNQIASYANTSNIRMLGIAYVALVLGLVSAVVLIPNTAATILGMPSAGWVPGIWVDVILGVLAVVPIVVVFSRPWVQRMLRGLGAIESRTTEGLRDLPELDPSSPDRLEVERPVGAAPPKGGA